MSYQQGRRIRDTGLKELITQNIVSGQGVGKGQEAVQGAGAGDRSAERSGADQD